MKVTPINIATLVILSFIPASLYSQATWTVNGFIKEAGSKSALEGASIYVLDQTTGTITDQQGYFEIKMPARKDSASLIISYVGYEDRRINIGSSCGPLEIEMTTFQLEAREVVVTASRVSETILEAPVSILKMDANAVKETPSENFYASLPYYKGVDVLTNSLLYKTINTRGFNNNANFRLAQLIDGIDNSLVGLGWPLGNVLGANDLDMEKVELIPGPASALYGANAFNGLVYMTTKDPFRYQGLTVQLKNGVNQVGTDAHAPALYSDLQMRFAKAINDRFAFKVNAGYIRGSDWLLTDSSDIYAFVSADQRGPDNPARDVVNIYGDEVAKTGLVTDTNGNKINISRTGYNVKDLIDNTTYSFKANAAVGYKLSDQLRLSYAFNFANATTSYSSLFNLKNILMYSNKLELTGTHFFVRTAWLANDLGDTYNAAALAGNINKVWKSSNTWFGDFANAYNGKVDGLMGNDLVLARQYADSGRLIPGTEAFNHIMDSLRDIPFSSGGAKVIDLSSKYTMQGEYDFNNIVKIADLIAGAEYRLTKLNSKGTIFIDIIGDPIEVNQYAGYVQASKELFNDHLKLLASLRFDKADNFKGVWSPRFATVYHPDDQNYFRASYQRGFRLPDPQLQFIDIAISATTHRLGGTALVDEPYNSRYNSFTQLSTIIFNDSVKNYLSSHPDELEAALDSYCHLLVKSPFDYIEPEKVQTFELGYRRLLMNEKFYLDINYFHNEYTGFIYSTTLVQADTTGIQLVDSGCFEGYNIYNGKLTNFLTVVNSSDKINVDGIEVGGSVVLPRGYLVSGNLTWIHSDILPGQQVPGIRTPPLKSNISISNQNLLRQLGFMINWRWTDAIHNWSNVSDQYSIDNDLPACSIIDAQISYRIPKAATSIKAGASNLLNVYHQDYAQGIAVGGIYYISLLYDGVFK